MTTEVFPVFLKMRDRPVLVVGGGPMALAKVRVLRRAGARITVVSPEVVPALQRLAVRLRRRRFRAADVRGCWLVVAAAPPAVNRAVARAAARARVFVNAVDDPGNASVYLGGVVARGGVTLAISTNGRAPALAGLIREGLEAVLPHDLHQWLRRAEALKRRQRATAVPMAHRRPLLLDALVRRYAGARQGTS